MGRKVMRLLIVRHAIEMQARAHRKSIWPGIRYARIDYSCDGLGPLWEKCLADYSEMGGKLHVQNAIDTLKLGRKLSAIFC